MTSSKCYFPNSSKIFLETSQVRKKSKHLDRQTDRQADRHKQKEKIEERMEKRKENKSNLFFFRNGGNGERMDFFASDLIGY